MQVVDIGLSEIDAFSVQYARAFKPPGFRLMFEQLSTAQTGDWPSENEIDRYAIDSMQLTISQSL